MSTKSNTKPSFKESKAKHNNILVWCAIFLISNKELEGIKNQATQRLEHVTISNFRDIFK